MAGCEICGKPLGYTKFTGIINGSITNMCRDCFFKHLFKEEMPGTIDV